MPLTDAALLHVAKAQHFAAARGVEIELVADSSWANIRDKLVAGHFDAVHMLAPAAIAVSLGIDQIEAPLVAPVALGLNGNAITGSQALFKLLFEQDLNRELFLPNREFSRHPRYPTKIPVNSVDVQGGRRRRACF